MTTTTEAPRWKIVKDCDCNCYQAEDACICNQSNLLCLDVFDAWITLPSDPYGALGGTKKFQSTGFDSPGYHQFGSCHNLYYVDDDFLIIADQELNYMAPGLFWSILVYSTAGSYSYGLTFNKGGYQMVEFRWCAAHCNGTFDGKLVGGYYSYYYTDYGGFRSWVALNPGSFYVPFQKVWGAYGEKIYSEQQGQQFRPPKNIGDCYVRCDEDSHPDEEDQKPGVTMTFEWKESFIESRKPYPPIVPLSLTRYGNYV